MIKYPTCYILQHKKHGTYPQNARLSSCFSDWVLKEYDNNKAWGDCFFTDKIEVAKMWSTIKKVKIHLTKETAPYFIIIGSDQTVIEAESLFP